MTSGSTGWLSSSGLGRLLLAGRGLVEASHPYPLAGVVCLTALVGLTADASRPATLAVAVFGMLCSQLVIGWTNDYVDHERDSRFQRSKPAVAGRIAPGLLPYVACVAFALALAAGAYLGALPLLLLVLGTAAGLAYNFRLKDTRWSWLPFIAGFALLPPYVWTALDAWRDEFALLYVVGLPLVPAVHLGQVLPDIETDPAAGRHGLAVVLGLRRSLLLLGACLLLSPLLAAVAAVWVDYDLAVLVAALAVYTLAAGLALALYRAGRPAAAFKPLVVAAVVFVAGWLASL